MWVDYKCNADGGYKWILFFNNIFLNNLFFGIKYKFTRRDLRHKTYRFHSVANPIRGKGEDVIDGCQPKQPA